MEYNEEKEHELLSKCKYFDGMPTPKETLKQNERMLWWYERKWLFESMKGSNFKQYIAEYKAAGLSDLESGDNVPIELKALLFERYCKYCHSTENAATFFRTFYKHYYS